MSYDGDAWRECITCGRSFDTSSPRYGPGAIECRDCEMGFVPEISKRPAPCAEEVELVKKSWVVLGLCRECGTPPNGDLLSDGRCKACVLAMETEQEQVRQEQERQAQEALRKVG